jgi:hypothetical protein
VSSEIVTSVPERVARLCSRTRRQVVAVQALGPLTILSGLAWALAQPYRIVFLDREGKGAYDYLVQPPLLVVLVGLAFALLIAPGLVEDLEEEEEEEPRGPAP